MRFRERSYGYRRAEPPGDYRVHVVIYEQPWWVRLAGAAWHRWVCPRARRAAWPHVACWDLKRWCRTDVDTFVVEPGSPGWVPDRRKGRTGGED